MNKFKKALNYIWKYTKLICSNFFYIFKVIFYDLLWKVTYEAAILTIKAAFTAVIPAYGLYLFYIKSIDSFTVDIFSIYVLTPLVVLLAFSGLFFNRAKVFPEYDKRHMKSVIAAEHALKGGIFYSVALICGFVVTSFYLIFNSDGTPIPTSLLKCLYMPSLILVFLAYTELNLSVFEIWPSLNKNLNDKNH